MGGFLSLLTLILAQVVNFFKDGETAIKKVSYMNADRDGDGKIDAEEQEYYDTIHSSSFKWKLFLKSKFGVCCCSYENDKTFLKHMQSLEIDN